jgi:hypothetical protein
MLTNMDAASVRSSASALPRIRVGGAVFLALAAAFGLRLCLAWLHATPNYFPDEYLYAALGRSLGSLHGASVRGGAAHFPALLQPLLTSLPWRIGSVETAFRLVQALHAAAFTLAALPAYAIARRVGVAHRPALAVGALALVVPDALYSGFVLAEPVAYPLALAAIWAGIRALAEPRPRTQAVFLAFAGLATFARLQLAVLLLCFAVAAVAIGLRERGLRRLLRQQRLLLTAGGLAAAAVGAFAAVRGLGYYAGARHLHFAPAAFGRNATVLLYAGGWAIMPGALVGVWCAAMRPRTRAEAAFGWLSATFVLALEIEASVWGDTSLVQERYLFYVLPLAAVAFCVQATRGWPHARAQALFAAGLLLLSVRVPLSGWAAPGSDDHSPFLLAVERLQMDLGTSSAGFVVAAAAALLAIAAALGAWRPRLAMPTLLGLALAASAASLAGATALDRLNSNLLAQRYLPAERSWVDAAKVGPATLLEAAGNRPSDGEEQLFWNRTLQHVAVLPGGSPPDRLAAANLAIDPHGVLRHRGRPIRGALVVDGYASTVELRDARVVARAPRDRLVVPNGVARLRLYIPGRSGDGAIIGSRGAILFWTTKPGVLVVTVRGSDVEIDGHAVHGAATVRLAVCRAGRYASNFSATIDRVAAGRPTGGHMSLPRFVPGACRP